MTKKIIDKYEYILYLGLLAICCFVIILVSSNATGNLSQAFSLINNDPSIDRIKLFYSPLPFYYIKFYVWLGLKPIHLSIVTFILFSTVLIEIGRHYIKNRKHLFFTISYILLNPYLLWSFYVSSDTAIDSLLFVTFIYSFLNIKKYGDSKIFLWLLFISIILFSITRPTSIYIGIFLMLYALVYVKERYVSQSLLVFIVVAISLVMFNYVKHDRAAVSINGGYNLFLGNHPQYLDGHMKYDIDTFFEKGGISICKNVNDSNEFSCNNLGEKDKLYSSKGIDFITNDPVAFIYRAIVKGKEYFFGIEKVPYYRTIAFLKKDGTIELQKQQVSYVVNIVYMVYKSIFILLFLLIVLSVIFYKYKTKENIIIIPWITMGIISLLTFPDSRFSLSYEALVPIWLALNYTLLRKCIYLNKSQ